MSLTDAFDKPDQLANLLIDRLEGVDAAEDFLQRTLAAVRSQGKEDGGDGGGDGGTPAQKSHKPDDQVLATQKKKKKSAIIVSPAAEAPAEAPADDQTLQQLEMIKAKVRREDHALYSTCPPPTAPPPARAPFAPRHVRFTPASRPVYASPRCCADDV